MSALSQRVSKIQARQIALHHSLKNHSAALQTDLREAMRFILWAQMNFSQGGEIDTTDIKIMQAEYAVIAPMIRVHQAVLADMEALFQEGTPEAMQARIETMATKYQLEYPSFDAQFGL